MTTDADQAAGAVETCLRSLVRAMPVGMWRREERGLLAFVSGIGIPLLNSVTVFHHDADLGLVRELLQTVVTPGLPCLLQGRSALSAKLSAIAAEHDMVPGEGVPLMTLQVQDWASMTPGVVATCRDVKAEERYVHAELLAAGFEAPRELMDQLVELFHAAPAFRMHVVDVAGVAVSTSVSVFTEPDSVGIFDVATPPEHRGHGYGTEATAHAIRAGLGLGATWAWLQSSREGQSVYERMGFRTIETWPHWTLPASE